MSMHLLFECLSSNELQRCTLFVGVLAAATAGGGVTMASYRTLGRVLGACRCEVVLEFVGERATIIRNVRELKISSDAFEQAMRACACAVVEAEHCSLVHATLRSVQRTLPHR
ncbi:hypothetical protein, conserved, partial [Eimeria acervulina]